LLSYREIIEKLKPCSWVYNDILELGDKIHFGFIAQELLDAFGSTYGFVEQGGDFLKVNYIEFIAPLVKIVQEHDARIASLEQQIKELNERLKDE